MADFTGKVVWITGASSGIGEALAYAFAAAGARLVLSARRADELARVQAACNRPEADILVLPLDLADHAAFETAAEYVLTAMGPVDILVNNAGLSHWGKIKDVSLAVIKQVMDVNFMGTVALTKAVLPTMLARRSGRIVVISSILGKIVTPKQSAYNASKHALHGFFDTLRAETAGDGIGVTLICPGFVRTNVAKNSLNTHGEPIGRDNAAIAAGLSPAHVAKLVLRAITQNRNEVVLAGAKEKFAVLLRRLLPSLYTKIGATKKAG